ncbi:putative RNA-directed DNA polymerase, eukaryota, reverse transcriptase zinc-binding domain protein [Tanacetum coccineum]
MSDNIPFEIQMEIIKMVSNVKSLIQFRSVSKPWKSFIDSSEFIIGYGASHTQTHSFILRYNNKNFEKAYDCVNWKFLYEVMSQMGFGRKWCGWIRACLETATSSILVNGTPTKEFILQRGIRQGDPLSPFLFLLVAEGLNIMMQEVLNRGLFEGIKIGSDEVCLTHLQYADDTIFIGKWNRNNIVNMMKLLKCFQLVSGLKVNLSKSKLYGIGIEMEEIEDYARSLECRAGKLPFLYLGLPIGNNMGRIENWNIMVDKFKSKLADWKAKMISFGGRLTLVKSVLGSLSLYFFSLFRAPMSVLHSLERISERFFWGGGTGDSKHMVWVKSEKAFSSYGVGGLNIGSLKAMNWALLSKWWWRFRVENEALWVKVIKSVYGAGGGLLDENISFRGNSVWGNIVKVGRDLGKIRINLASTVKWEVGDGNAILFWDDTWVGGKRLRDQFPRWQISEDGKFSVKDLRDLIDEKTLGSTGRQFVTPWCKSIPKKVCVFIWRLYHGRFPVRTILNDIGIDLHTLLCPSCNDVVESLDHCFVLCLKVQLLWKRVFEWWALENIDVFSIHDVLNITDINSFNGINRERWKAVIWSTLYIIWSNRNQLIFRRNGSMIPDLFKEVQLRSFEWISVRSKKDEVKREEWFGGPIDRV